MKRFSKIKQQTKAAAKKLTTGKKRRLMIISGLVLLVLLAGFGLWKYLSQPNQTLPDQLIEARASTKNNLLPKQIALDLFSSVYGDIPGGKARFKEVRRGDGTMTLRALGAHWSELSERQKEVIKNIYQPSDRSDSSLFAPKVYAQNSNQELIKELTARAKQKANIFAGKLGVDIRAMEIEVVPASTWEGGVTGDAGPEKDGRLHWADDFETCHIRISEGETDDDSTLTHEVFHCMQYEITPIPTFLQLADWIVEGSAEWARATVDQSQDRYIINNFVQWQQNQHSLYIIDEPAVGYFWTLESMEIDPWQEIPRMFEAGNNGHAAHNRVLSQRELALQLGTRAFNALAHGDNVDAIWSLTPQSVPQEFHGSTTISPDRSVDTRWWGKYFSRTAAQQINVDGKALDIELKGEVGAVQEIGGGLKRFNGGFKDRICFDEGSAFAVYINIAFVDSGEGQIKLSVPSDEEIKKSCDKEEKLAGCSRIEGNSVRLNAFGPPYLYVNIPDQWSLDTDKTWFHFPCDKAFAHPNPASGWVAGLHLQKRNMPNLYLKIDSQWSDLSPSEFAETYRYITEDFCQEKENPTGRECSYTISHLPEGGYVEGWYGGDLCRDHRTSIDAPRYLRGELENGSAYADGSTHIIRELDDPLGRTSYFRIFMTDTIFEKAIPISDDTYSNMVFGAIGLYSPEELNNACRQVINEGDAQRLQAGLIETVNDLFTNIRYE